jgi:multicomponent K+:H+ antiporter subunit D
LKALVSPEVGETISSGRFILFALLLVSGLAAVIALSRAGIVRFWSGARSVPHLKWVEALAVSVAIGACVLLAVYAEPVIRYTNATAAALHSPGSYIDAVLSARALPGPTTSELVREGSP